jgi:hypothetical protein
MSEEGEKRQDLPLPGKKWKVLSQLEERARALRRWRRPVRPGRRLRSRRLWSKVRRLVVAPTLARTFRTPPQPPARARPMRKTKSVKKRHFGVRRGVMPRQLEREIAMFKRFATDEELLERLKRGFRLLGQECRYQVCIHPDG